MADQWEKGGGEIKIIEIILSCVSKNFKENRASRLSGRKNDHFCSARFLVSPFIGRHESVDSPVASLQPSLITWIDCCNLGNP